MSKMTKPPFPFIYSHTTFMNNLPTRKNVVKIYHI